MNLETPLFRVILEDHDLLVINKPAGLVCHPTKGDSLSSLIGRIRLYLGEGREAHMVNRLDRETSGVVIVAKNLEAARRVRKDFESRTVEKEYLGIVHGWLDQDGCVIEAPLGKDESSRVAIKDCVRADGSPSITEVTVVQRGKREMGQYSLLRIQPLTGRKHQIRIHLAHIGHALVGDKLYGSDENYYLAFVEGRLPQQARKALLTEFHALHCSRIKLRHQDLGELTFKAAPEAWFLGFVRNMGLELDKMGQMGVK